MGFQGVEARGAAKFPTLHRRDPIAENYLAPDVISAKTKNFRLKILMCYVFQGGWKSRIPIYFLSIKLPTT